MFLSPPQAHSPTAVAFAAVLLLALACGCTQQGQIVLHQPSFPPAQKYLELTSKWAFSTQAGGRQNCLLAFPLPGAQDGPRDFLLYTSAPAGEGRFHVDAQAPSGVRGFLIQAVGDLRGKTTFVDGTVRVRKVWLAPRLRRLDFDLRCDDRTRITGRAVVEYAAEELRRFERHYAADVALLSPPASQPADPVNGTAPRTPAQP